MVRAQLLLACPLGLVVTQAGPLFGALDHHDDRPGRDYVETLLVVSSAVRDRFGQVPRDLDEQLTAARLTLCVIAGSVGLLPRGAGAASAPQPPPVG